MPVQPTDTRTVPGRSPATRHKARLGIRAFGVDIPTPVKTNHQGGMDGTSVKERCPACWKSCCVRVRQTGWKSGVLSDCAGSKQLLTIQKYPTSSAGYFSFHSLSVIGVLFGKNTLTVSTQPPQCNFTGTKCSPLSPTLVSMVSELLMATVKKILGSVA